MSRDLRVWRIAEVRTTVCPVLVEVLVLTYALSAPTQVLELPVSTIKVSDME